MHWLKMSTVAFFAVLYHQVWAVYLHWRSKTLSNQTSERFPRNPSHLSPKFLVLSLSLSLSLSQFAILIMEKAFGFFSGHCWCPMCWDILSDSKDQGANVSSKFITLLKPKFFTQGRRQRGGMGGGRRPNFLKKN